MPSRRDELLARVRVQMDDALAEHEQMLARQMRAFNALTPREQIDHQLRMWQLIIASPEHH